MLPLPKYLRPSKIAPRPPRVCADSGFADYEGPGAREQAGGPVFREVLLMSFFVNMLALAIPIFVQQVYDRVVAHGTTGINTLYGLMIGMIFVLIFDFVLR